MNRINRKHMLWLGLFGLAIGISGNFMNKYGMTLGLPLKILGLVAMGVFWIYSVVDVIRSRFWTRDTKIKFALATILLPLVGPFYYYYSRNEVVMPGENVADENESD